MGGAYRAGQSGEDATLSCCFFCGEAGPAAVPCARCLVPMPRQTCHCGATWGPSAIACAACGSPLLEARIEAPCPRCKQPLAAVGVDARATIHACFGCRGLFVPPRAWCTVIARPDLVQAIEARFPATTADPGALLPMLRCPACAAEMERGRFAAASPVVIDVCTQRQHGVWLDAGELGGIARFAARRAAIGVDAVRREVEVHEALAAAPVSLHAARAEAEAAVARAARIERLANAKRTGGILLALIVVARLIYVLIGRSSPSAPERQAEETIRAASSAGRVLESPR